ncbi:MAG: glycosyltransferase [Rhizomicrobium sp.]
METDDFPHVVILTGNHLCHNPRVFKEAGALAAGGYQVTVLGAFFDPGLKQRDRVLLENSHFQFVPVIDLTLGGPANILPRAKVKLASCAYRRTGTETGWQLGYAYPGLMRAASSRNADLYIAHSEQGMAVACKLLRHGRKVAVDMEDWFSRDCPSGETRPVEMLARLERELLVNGAFGLCPSHAMADALAAAYGCRRPFAIYNSFPWAERASLDGKLKDRATRTRPSLHWFSQTLGPGRGLDDVLAALALIPHDAEIHFRGNPVPGFKERLLAQAPPAWRSRIFFHPIVHNDELLSRIAEHDIGIAAETPDCPSRNLTVTNKLLQYLLAGLAVVASDTAGQREVAQGAGIAVHLYRPGEPASLAKALNGLLGYSPLLNQAKAAALQAAKVQYCWEADRQRLLDVMQDCLKPLGQPSVAAGHV